MNQRLWRIVVFMNFNFYVMSEKTIVSLPMGWRQYWILIVSSMEQIIGAGLSTVAGIIIPMIVLLGHLGLSAPMQGFIGAVGLVGIAVGSAVVGALIDRSGYLFWFRFCPLLIIAGSLVVYLWANIPILLIGLFVIGFGVGGGYSLDSAYISELMPARWKLFMVGVAKGMCALGFLGIAVVCYLMIKKSPDPDLWNKLIISIFVLGIITFLMRIRWAESPRWLMLKGRRADAIKAAEFFFGSGVVPANITPEPETSVTWRQMFRGDNLKRVILTGVPWACEGLGVYGFGVFLPVLIMALGMSDSQDTGISRIIASLEYTSVVNFFILPGFALGLLFVRKTDHIKMLADGFFACSAGLLILLAAYLLKLPAWVSVVGFIIFEVFLNAGPHLVTFILPSQIFPVEVRGTGSGIAAMLGKIGAVTGVILMPFLLKTGGMTLVLVFSFLVQITGAFVAIFYQRQLK